MHTEFSKLNILNFLFKLLTALNKYIQYSYLYTIEKFKCLD